MLLADMDDVIAKMTTLKAHGVGFALDDFGTGYSSLSYLKLLPIDQPEIDRSFVHDMLLTRHASSIVRAIITLAYSMDCGGSGGR
jgi:EAL domain-containing protein (putative c-di-GMP-specific phosphodiesterase class I)